MTSRWISPLAEIEHAVQARAKDLDLDIAHREGNEKLRALIDDEITRWEQDRARGRRAVAIAEPDRLAERAFRNLAGYGPLEQLLADDDVWEVMINAPDAIFVKRHRGGSGYHDEVFHDDDHVVRILTKLLDDASASHRKLDVTEGLQDAQLEHGARMHIVHRDIGRDGHLLVNIRKFTGVAYRSLDELVARGTLTRAVANFLSACVRCGLSVVIAGAPGTGKTTLLSCCAAELDPDVRVVIAEEVFEADVPLANVAHMQTRPPRADRSEVDLRRLVSGFLRMAPDVAIVGEVRDREALPLLLTLSSGVKGLTTIHAGSARQALSRLRFLCQLSGSARDLPMSALNSLVSEAIDIVVHCSRRADGVRLDEVLAVEDQQGGAEAIAFTVTDVFRRPTHDSELGWTGVMPARAGRAFAAAGSDIRTFLESGG